MIEAGTKVTFVSKKVFSHSFSLTVKNGTLIEWGDEYSLVKVKGKTVRVANKTIREADNKNALTESLLAMQTVTK